MLEIRTDKSKLAKNVFVLVFVVASSMGIVLFLLSDSTMMFFIMSLTLLVIVVPLAIALSLPQKIVVNSASETVETYIFKKRVSQFEINEIEELEYYSGKNGYCVTTIKKRNDDIPFSVASGFFKDEDVRALFDTLAPYSEKYGFDVKEKIEFSPSGFSDTVMSPNDESPYRIK